MTDTETTDRGTKPECAPATVSVTVQDYGIDGVNGLALAHAALWRLPAQERLAALHFLVASHYNAARAEFSAFDANGRRIA